MSITQAKLQISFVQGSSIGFIHLHEVIIHVFTMAAYLEIQRREGKGLSICVCVCSQYKAGNMLASVHQFTPYLLPYPRASSLEQNGCSPKSGIALSEYS